MGQRLVKNKSGTYSKFTFVLLLYLLFCLPLFRPATTANASLTFVTASGTSLSLNGAPFKFLGVNRYNLLTTYNTTYIGCGTAWTQPQLTQLFSEVHAMGGNTVRFWAFQSFTGTSSANFAEMDYVANVLAPQYNVKLIPVLENQWADCTHAQKDDTWYKTGYLAPYGGYTFSYKDYVTQIVTHFKNNQNILAWQLMNEAEDDAGNGTCANGTNLYNFAADMSSYIKSIDPNHLVSLGTMGNGQCGTIGLSGYENLHAIPTIDIVEAHDYNNETQAIPGSPLASNVGAQIYEQDHNWSWNAGQATQISIGAWTTLTYTIPAGVTSPIQRVGINFYVPSGAGYTGSIYLDKITIGSSTYSFEGKTTEGWYPTGNPTTTGITTTVAYDGTQALEAHMNVSPSSQAQIYINAPASAVAGTPITMYLYAPTAAPAYFAANGIAMDLQVAKMVNKPFFIGEAGILTGCAAGNCFTPTQRAAYFNAKMSAIFSQGAAGYLVWSYRDSTSGAQAPGGYDFDAQDPLYQTMQSIAHTALPQ